MKTIYLAHLGYNMWKEAPVDRIDGIHACSKPFVPQATASYDLRFDMDVWEKIVSGLQAAKSDTLLLDIGEGMVYDRHPELAVNGSWTKQRLADEVSRLKGLGIQVLPKLNFSTAHDEWLGIYARMVSTPQYYQVCQDVIDEVAEVFQGAPLFFLGMDEENWPAQCTYKYAVVRQEELWWHDLYFYIKAAEKHGMRPWIFADYVHEHPDVFWKNISHDILLTNWYYGDFRKEDEQYYHWYIDLAERGFDQVPCGSNWDYTDNLQKTLDYVKPLPQEHILGIMQTVWHPTIRMYEDRHVEAIREIGALKF